MSWRSTAPHAAEVPKAQAKAHKEIEKKSFDRIDRIDRIVFV
jgi:hypothetical protein